MERLSVVFLGDLDEVAYLESLECTRAPEVACVDDDVSDSSSKRKSSSRKGDRKSKRLRSGSISSSKVDDDVSNDQSDVVHVPMVVQTKSDKELKKERKQRTWNPFWNQMTKKLTECFIEKLIENADILKEVETSRKQLNLFSRNDDPKTFLRKECIMRRKEKVADERKLKTAAKKLALAELQMSSPRGVASDFYTNYAFKDAKVRAYYHEQLLVKHYYDTAIL